MKLKDYLTGIERRLERIEDILGDNTKTMLRNTITVEEHERRSTALENSHKDLSGRFKPIEQHVLIVNSVMKLGVILVGLLVSLRKLNII